MVRRELIRSIRAEEQRIDTDVADAMEQATKREVDNGWASGPVSEQGDNRSARPQVGGQPALRREAG